MSLRYALLGLLSREPMTGYDLTKQFDSTIGFFWNAKHSQIYPELATLTKEGLVTFELVTQTSKPNKKVYTITEAGRTALEEWIAEPADMRSVKDPLILRAWPIGTVDPRPLRQQISDRLAVLEPAVEALRRKEKAHAEIQAASPENDLLGDGLCLRYGVLQLEALCDWMHWALDKLDRVIAAGVH